MRIRTANVTLFFTALLAVPCVPAVAQGYGYGEKAAVVETKPVPDVGFTQKLEAQVPLDLEFYNENAEYVPLSSYFHDGKPVVLALVYYECPMLCGEVMLGMLESFNQLQLVMGKDYEVVTVSFAAGETHELAAAKKKNLVRGYSKGGAADGWHFLTGKKENIDKLADTVGFGYSYDEQSKQYAHAGGIMVLTPSGKLSRYLFGIDYPSKDLRFALIEASEGRVGSMAEQLLMLCYHYDPSTGTYSFAVMRALQILGPLTVILIGGLMWLLFRIERRKQREEASPETGHKPVLGG